MAAMDSVGPSQTSPWKPWSQGMGSADVAFREVVTGKRIHKGEGLKQEDCWPYAERVPPLPPTPPSPTRSLTPLYRH